MNLNTYDSTLQVATSTAGEVTTLEDKRFTWMAKRNRGRRLAVLYKKSHFDTYAERAQMCATRLQFYEMENGDKQLMGANFCHLRLCPMCTARRALRAAYKLSKILDQVEQDHNARFVFLTLTVKNVPGEELGETLGQLTKAWTKLIRHRQFERSIGGWFRAVEITRHGKMYHPHIHAILAVSPSYFSPKSGLYITHDEWVDRWKKAFRADYRPSVYIETAKAKGQYSAGGKAAIEAAKYSVKDSDYIDPNLSDDEAAEIVKTYTNALHRRRLTAFGGWLKDAAKAFDAEDLDDGDLVHVEDERIRPDLADYVTTYDFHFGVGDYILSNKQVNPLKLRRE